MESERPAAATAVGGQLPGLLEAVREHDQRKATAGARLAALDTAAQAAPPDPTALEARVRQRLADWRGLLGRNVESGREVVRTLLMGPLRFARVVDGQRRGYRFTGTIALERIVAGIVDSPKKTRGELASPVCVSWNQLYVWLRAVDGLRCAA